jgi:hypothetical protein
VGFFRRNASILPALLPLVAQALLPVRFCYAESINLGACTISRKMNGKMPFSSAGFSLRPSSPDPQRFDPKENSGNVGLTLVGSSFITLDVTHN